MAVLTTIFAFMPLLYIYGIFGKFIRVIPMVVIPVLAFSLIEALLILPAHLSGGRPVASKRKHLGPVGRLQRWIRAHLEGFVEKLFAPFVQLAVRWRYVTVACAFLVLCVAIGYFGGGFIKFSLLPKVESDNVWASLSMPMVSMPMGTSVEQTREVVARIEDAARRIEERIEAERRENNSHSAWKKLKAKVGQCLCIFPPISASSRSAEVMRAGLRLRPTAVPTPQRSIFNCLRASIAEASIHQKKLKICGVRKWGRFPVCRV
jgi:hypothetical protein